MLHLGEHRDLGELGRRLLGAPEANAALLDEVMRAACRRLPSFGQTKQAARLTQLIQSQAWTDAALALIELELPLWRVRRLAYDEGEWHCALSRERELPDWLDQSIEAHHAELPLALLCAFVEAQGAARPERRTSVPTVGWTRDFYETICSDNFA